MCVKRLSFCAVLLTVSIFSWAHIHSDGVLGVGAEKYDRGLLVGKSGISGKASAVAKTDKNGFYLDSDMYLPLQYKDVFPNRWKFGIGYLRKLTDHFTADFGCKYTFLQHLENEHVKQWMEYAVSVRSDLLMEPRFSLFYQPKFKAWGGEFSFKYEFDLGIFDLNNCELVWDNLLGFYKVKHPYGKNGGIRNRKDHYKYIETSLMLKKTVSEHLHFYLGPTFVYNTGGIKKNTLFNQATYKSHFCSLSFRMEFNF